MLLHWIWLATRNMTDNCKVRLLEHFHDPEQIYFAEEDSFAQLEFLTEKGAEALKDKSLEEARQILDECTDLEIDILTLADGKYPNKLKNISDPPVVLYCRGKLPDLDGNPVIGVVGTRSASAYGLKCAKQMGYQIARCGGILVSGMAKGIDRAAMEGALMAGCPVVGILGCGVDVVYPAVNKGLFADTVRYGCLLSEFPPKTPPYHYNFPRRNRNISGLSDGVLVVEAPGRSGALITARQAMDQGRDVFVVPGNIDVASAQGSNALLRDGAMPAGCGWDVVGEYEGRYPGKVKDAGQPEVDFSGEDRSLAQVAQKSPKTGAKPEKKKCSPKKVIDNPENEPYIDLTKILPSLSETERAIVSQLAGGGKLADDIIADSGLSTPVVLSCLTILEVRGIVRRLPGRMFELAGEK